MAYLYNYLTQVTERDRQTQTKTERRGAGERDELINLGLQFDVISAGLPREGESTFPPEKFQMGPQNVAQT